MKNKLAAGLVALLMVFVFLSGCQSRPFASYTAPQNVDAAEDSSDVIAGMSLQEANKLDILDGIKIATKDGVQREIYRVTHPVLDYFYGNSEIIGAYETKDSKVAPYLMYLQAFKTADTQKSGAVAGFRPHTDGTTAKTVHYYFKDMSDYIVYKDSEITVYNVMELSMGMGYNDSLSVMQDSVKFDMNWAKSSIESLKEQLKAKGK